MLPHPHQYPHLLPQTIHSHFPLAYRRKNPLTPQEPVETVVLPSQTSLSQQLLSLLPPHRIQNSLVKEVRLSYHLGACSMHADFAGNSSAAIHPCKYTCVHTQGSVLTSALYVSVDSPHEGTSRSTSCVIVSKTLNSLFRCFPAHFLRL